MSTLAALLLLALTASSALAAQIVPAHIDTPGGFGPGLLPPPGCIVIHEGFNGQEIECDVPIPPGTTELAGWGGYAVDLFPFSFKAFPPSLPRGEVGYMSTEIWHDGGTPHRLAQPHWPSGIFTLPDVFYPAGDGHKTLAVPGHRVFARFWCVGVDGGRPPWCAMSLTGHFRVSE